MTVIWKKKRGARASAVLALAVSALAASVVLLGYGLGLDRVARMFPNAPATVPTTAISFMFLAACLGSVRSAFPASRWLSYLGAGLVVAIAITNLLMVHFGAKTSLDAMLGLSARDGDMMAPGTAYGLILAAICVFGLTRRGLSEDLALYSAMAGLTTSLGVLFLHSFDPGSPMSVPIFRATSFPTAVLFTLTFAAILFELNLFGGDSETLVESDMLAEDANHSL